MKLQPACKIILIGLSVWLAGCAGTGRNTGEDTVFPPSQLLPLEVAIAPPLVSFSHETSHQILETWNSSGGQRRLLMQCTWDEGLDNFVHSMIPGTEVFFLGSGRNPLAATGTGVRAEEDSLGRMHFTLESPSALDLARSRGWTHLVVPGDLHYQAGEKNDDPILKSSVAIIDILEQRIIWQGEISSENVPEKLLGANDELLPALTSYESCTYRFILDLARVMNRRLGEKPESRHQFAQICQNLPPLLGQ